MAESVQLAWSIDADKPIERPSIVMCRYTGTTAESVGELRAL
jgi:hypothetical protein